MDSLQIYISCNTQSNLISEAWVKLFAQTFQSLLTAKSNTHCETITSFDKPDAAVVAKSNYALMIISSDYYTSANLTAELDLLKKISEKGTGVYRLIFTTDQSGVKNDGVNAMNHKFFLDDPFARIDLSTEEGYFSEKTFWLKLIDLSNLIMPDIKPERHKQNKIFMAEPSPDIIQEWESVNRELTHMGYEILMAPDLKNKADINQKTLEGFEKANLIIHMIGGENGEKVDGVDVLMEQISLAASYCEKTGMNRRLIWMPDTLVIRDELQRLAIEKMKRDNKALTGAEIIQSPIESFKAILQHRINKSEEKKEDVTASNKVYVIYTPQMVKEAKEFDNIMKGQSNEVIHPLKSDDKGKLLTHHWKSLLSCDTVVLFYGAGQKEWLNSKRKDIIKASGFGRKEPIPNKILVKNTGDSIEKMELDDFHLVDVNKMSEIKNYLKD